MNKGDWGGEQIINSEWLQNITSTKVPATEVNTFGCSFGYFWWINENRQEDISDKNSDYNYEY